MNKEITIDGIKYRQVEEPKPELRDGDVVNSSIPTIVYMDDQRNVAWTTGPQSRLTGYPVLFNLNDLAKHKGTILLVNENEVGVVFKRRDIGFLLSGEFDPKNCHCAACEDAVNRIRSALEARK